MTYNTKLVGSTVFASPANAVPFADGSCTVLSALFLSTWRITLLLFAVMEDQVFNASPLLFQYYEPPLSLIWKLCGAKQFHVCIVALHEHNQMPCIHGLGAKSCLHVTLVFSRRILISALEAARSFGHHAMRVHTKPFVLQSSTSFCNASCISFQPSLSALIKRTLFYRWRRLFCSFASKHMSFGTLRDRNVKRNSCCKR